MSPESKQQGGFTAIIVRPYSSVTKVVVNTDGGKGAFVQTLIDIRQLRLADAVGENEYHKKVMLSIRVVATSQENSQSGPSSAGHAQPVAQSFLSEALSFSILRDALANGHRQTSFAVLSYQMF